jgi:transcriptional regulator of arginine metabolism
MTSAITKTARHARITEMVRKHRVNSQSELAKLLLAEGLVVTQATLSRDLEELGAVKLRGVDGQPAEYVIPEEGSVPLRPAEAPPAKLVRLLEELLTGAEASSNMVILRTPPGAAQYLASAMDRTGLPQLIGTIAGDDTVLCVCKDPLGGEEFKHQALRWAAREE